MDNTEFLQDMLNGIQEYKTLKQQLDTLREQLLNMQKEYENYECTQNCIRDAVIDIVKAEMNKAGVI